MAVAGFFYLLLTFILCFAVVHIAKLAFVGFLSLKKKEETPPKQEKENTPVYYIVEKKRRQKTSYSEPKEFQFKK